MTLGSGMDTELHDMAIKQAAICRIFANYKRILILWTLVEGEKSAGEIAYAIGSSPQNTSQHLSLMRHKNLLQARREAQTIFYSIIEDEISAPCRLLIETGSRYLQCG